MPDPSSSRISRRNVLSMGLTLPLLGGLSACRGAEPGATTGGGSAGGRTQVTFWSAIRGSHEVVEAFNDTHDDIEVIFSQIPTGGDGGYAMLRNAYRAGNAPDVATLEYPQVPGFVIDGIASDLTDLMSDQLHSDLLPEALARTTYDGRIYSIPNDLAPMVLHYRQDIFAEHDFDVPTTWDEFAELGYRIRDELDGERIANFPMNGAMHFAGFSQQAGAQWFDTRDDTWHVNMADDGTQRVADYWQQLIDDDVVTFVAEGQEYDAMLSRGSTLTRLTGAWDAGAQMGARPGQAGVWSVAPLPQWEEGAEDLGDHGGSTFTVTSESEVVEAAMEFITWQVSHPDSMRARLSAGTSSMFPVVDELVDVARDVFDDEYYNGQDIYTLFAEEARKVRDDWSWGPRMMATAQVMEDNFARAQATDETLLDAVRTTQAGTVPDLRALGLSVSEHTG